MSSVNQLPTGAYGGGGGAGNPDSTGRFRNHLHYPGKKPQDNTTFDFQWTFILLWWVVVLIFGIFTAVEFQMGTDTQPIGQDSTKPLDRWLGYFIAMVAVSGVYTSSTFMLSVWHMCMVGRQKHTQKPEAIDQFNASRPQRVFWKTFALFMFVILFMFSILLVAAVTTDRETNNTVTITGGTLEIFGSSPNIGLNSGTVTFDQAQRVDQSPTYRETMMLSIIFHMITLMLIGYLLISYDETGKLPQHVYKGSKHITNDSHLYPITGNGLLPPMLPNLGTGESVMENVGIFGYGDNPGKPSNI